MKEAGAATADALALALPAPAAARRRRLGWPLYAAGVFIALLAAVAIAAPLLAPHNPERGSLRARLKGPTLEAPDGKAHLLGTDHLGRDVLSRMVFGTRVSLTIGFAAVAVGGIVGGLLGLVAGFRGGWVDEIVMTVADAQLAFPFILLAIGIIAVLGPSFPNLIIVVGLSGWVTYARVLRSQVLSLRQRDFVSAILALGGSVPRVLIRHILPNVASTFMVIATLELARAIVLEATLSFLGPGDPAADAVLGRDDPRGARVPRHGLVDLGVPRRPAHADLARRQPDRGLAARRAGPDAPRRVLSAALGAPGSTGRVRRPSRRERARRSARRRRRGHRRAPARAGPPRLSASAVEGAHDRRPAGVAGHGADPPDPAGEGAERAHDLDAVRLEEAGAEAGVVDLLRHGHGGQHRHLRRARRRAVPLEAEPGEARAIASPAARCRAIRASSPSSRTIPSASRRP